MIYVAASLLLALALLGHAALWVSVVNRLNAYAIDHSVLRWVNRGCLAVCALVPPVLAVWVIWHWLTYRSLAIHELARGEASPLVVLRLTVVAYLGFCVIVGMWALVIWAMRLALRDAAKSIVQA